ncbi:S-adenosyl-L-methionine-dependent methyltransferase [Tricharina praecox]|uniref:S-adenosyl-L-methionine-dependent methyltransferase n=1 Tax=Tricharina praecox TaxID=43433 RepID=UPI00221E7E4A|nr:S-adenosyl-L-methionine-dependent methyltransferase [Tricharina praecox]KAI5856852.1 S-adenosyl-L-methionine-dependent methyltransferase [Tricharina praecox]
MPNVEVELHKAPIKRPQRVLDVRTGTGIWAIDMADTYLMAEVIGTDLSPIQPGWVPPNCRFQVDDAEEDRNLNQAISDWPKLLLEFCRCAAPGGFVELTELGGAAYSDDGSMSTDNPCAMRLEIAGFVDIATFAFKQPLSLWPKCKKLKQVGAMALVNSETAFHAYCLAAFTCVLDLDRNEADRICCKGYTVVKNKNVHAYILL